MKNASERAEKPRLVWLDGARSFALLAMIVFHTARDMEIFGYLEPGTTLHGGWAIFARLIAGSFLFLSGISLIVAHGQHFRLRSWLKRLSLIVAAAALVSAVTAVVFPERFVYFGILHVIAVSNVIGVILLRLPAMGLASLAAFVLVVSSLPNSHLFSTAWLSWTGLSASVRPSLDFLPLFPWLAPLLVGMAVSKCLTFKSAFQISQNERLSYLITWPGRHSLSIYLVHQPILIGSIWLVSKVVV
ncbi:heparan-alpha-glucosaminide N-acetyltransferase [Aestuariivita boseongensis]|uniref:heparan-alpha-glucosaminide N-acetyltransferase n=1 Tax=Aestuariivita boseongensis TaxID=1470562 RepID=UPI0006814CB8|nr:heparan-alpha-glucosaminide N-acetyltransferase [Aestuariivita boseongensis]